MTRIFDAAGEVVGAGFIVGPGQVATCAHVVCAALGGRPEDRTAPPGRLRVDLPLSASSPASDAVVRGWRPIDPESGIGDVAILELLGDAPNPGRVPPLHRPDRVWGHRFRVLGFPAGMQDGVWTAGRLRERQGTRWLQLQSDPHSPSIARGFSGAPVWDEEVEAVVGMTVAGDVRPGSTTAYLVPIEDVLGVDPRLLPNPYRGLEPFGEEHADIFYGREDEVARLEALLDHQAVVAVVGRSGTGKSSLVRAGLLPRLRRRGVRIVEHRPGPADESPGMALDRLTERVAELLTDEAADGVLLFADQFEELVGVGPPTQESTPAQEMLRRLVEMVEAARLPDGVPSLRVVLTLRWEAMNELLTDEVREMFDQGTFLLAAMSRDQLRQAIVGPTVRAPGLDFDPGLVERILDDAVAEPGQLPLVESLLSQLWETRLGGTLKATAYQQLGGVKGAVARHAELAVGHLVPGDDTAIRRLLTRLARPDDSGGFVRRAVRLESLSVDQQQLAERLARSRLLVAGQAPDGNHTVELAHQALIDHWPRLQRWLHEDRDFLVWQHEIDAQRQAWERAGHDHDALLRGVALTRAEEWLERRRDDVSPPGRAYVEASGRRERRQARRRLTLLSVLGVALVMTLLLATLFTYQRRVTAREQAMSDSRALATLSADTATSDPAWSVALALAAYDRHPTPEAENALFRRYVTYQMTEAVLSGAPGDIVDVDASVDGRLVVARTSGGTVTTWTRQPGRAVDVHHLPGADVYMMDVSDDGSRILLADVQGIRVYDVAAGRSAWEIPVAAEQVRAMVLGNDGSAALRLGDLEDEEPGTLELWEPTDGGEARLVDRVMPGSPAALSEIVGFGPEPDTLILWDHVPGTTGDGRLVSWNVATGQVTTVVEDGGTSRTVTPDGVLVVCREPDEVVRVDLRQGTERSFPLPGSCAYPRPTVDANADLLVTEDEVAVDLQTGQVVGQPRPPVESTLINGPVMKVGDRYFTLHSDATSVMVTEVLTEPRPWPAERVRAVGELGSAGTRLPVVRSAQLLPDGEHILSLTEDSADLVVSRSRSPNDVVATVTRPAPRPTDEIGLRINDDGTLLADRVSPDTIQVRSLPDLDLVGEITTEPLVGDATPDLSSAQVHWDFDRLLTYDGPQAQWWDPSTGDLVAELDVRDTGLVNDDQAGDFVLAGYRHPDLVAITVLGDPDMHVVDVDTGREVDSLRVGDDVIALRFQEDSRYFGLLRQGARIEMWDRDDGRRVLGPLRSLSDLAASDGPGFAAGFLPEPGSYLLGAHGQLQWYEPGSAAPTRRLDLGTARAPIDASADGSVVLYVDERSFPTVMPPLHIDTEVWQRTLCDVVVERPFTAEERASLPPGTATHALC